MEGRDLSVLSHRELTQMLDAIMLRLQKDEHVKEKAVEVEEKEKIIEAEEKADGKIDEVKGEEKEDKQLEEHEEEKQPIKQETEGEEHKRQKVEENKQELQPVTLLFEAERGDSISPKRTIIEKEVRKELRVEQGEKEPEAKQQLKLQHFSTKEKFNQVFRDSTGEKKKTEAFHVKEAVSNVRIDDQYTNVAARKSNKEMKEGWDVERVHAQRSEYDRPRKHWVKAEDKDGKEALEEICDPDMRSQHHQKWSLQSVHSGAISAAAHMDNAKKGGDGQKQSIVTWENDGTMEIKEKAKVTQINGLWTGSNISNLEEAPNLMRK